MTKFAWGAALSAAVFTTHAGAASAAQPDVPAEQTAVDETEANGEIIVTAQRRSENLQDVPLSVIAFSGDTIASANIDSVSDLPRIAPSLQFDSGIQSAKARFAIRGVGSAGGTAIEPSVATFVDGFYIAREGATTGAYIDLQSVEVLRGPQGTLFGRNASVGALSVRSVLPTRDFEGELNVEYGTGNRYRAEGFVNVPVSDSAAFRLAAYGEKFDGLYRNLVDGRTVGGVDSFGGRLTGRFDLSPSLSIIVRGTYNEQGGDNAFANFALVPSTFPEGRLAVYQSRLAAAGAGPIDLDPFDRTLNQFIGDDLSDRQWGVNSTIEWELGGGYSVKLLSSYLDWKSDQIGTGLLGVTIPTASQFVGWGSKTHTQELQLISPTNDLLGGRFDFVAGLYYLNEDYRSNESFQFFRGFCDIVLITNALYAPCVAGTTGTAFDQRYNQNTESFAAYAQGTIGLIESVDLVLGARWTTERKSAAVVQVVNAPTGNLQAANENRSFELKADRPTWRANLNWRPTDDLLIYTSYSTGYKSGGFNSQTAAAVNVGGVPTLIDRLLQPETVENFEIGAKSSFLDRRLQVNATAFRMDVKNFQDRAFNGLTFALENAGTIRSEGVELEIVARPSPKFRTSIAFAFLDAVFTDYPAGANLPGLPGTRDLTGTQPSFTPEISGSVGAEYRDDVGQSGLSFLLRSDLTVVADNPVRTINDNNPQTIQDGYSLLSARVTLFGPNERWSLSVFADNIFNHGYCTSLTGQAFGGLFGAVANGQTAVRCAAVAPLRTVNVAAGVRF